MKICFVSLHAFPVVAPSAGGVFGGSETRAVMLAEGLARTGNHDVQFLARHPRLTKTTKVAGVDWLPWRDFWTETRAAVAESIDITQLPRLRLKRWNSHLLWQLPLLVTTRLWRMRRDPRSADATFSRIDADLFVAFGINSAAVQTVFNAQRLGKPSLLMIGSDGDLDERFFPGSSYVSPYQDRAEPSHWVLTNATHVIAQTQSQRKMLRQRFDRDCDVLPNPFDLPTWQHNCTANRFESPWADQPFCLWVGRAESVHKRPALLVDLALRCPEQNFLMILNPSDPAVAAQVHHRAPQNLKILESVPFAQMASLFSQASLFINTSHTEGFPNVFLQAIASRVPILSLEVGAEFLETAQAGQCVHGDLSAAAQAIHASARGQFTTSQQQQHAFDYLCKHYLLATVSAQLSKRIQNLAQTP